MSVSIERTSDHSSDNSAEQLRARQDQFRKLQVLEALGIFDIIARKTRTKPYRPEEPQPPLSEEERKKLRHESMEGSVARGTAMRAGSAYWIPAPKDAEFPSLTAPRWRLAIEEPKQENDQWNSDVVIRVTHSKSGDGHSDIYGRFDTARVSVLFDGEKLSVEGRETVFSGQISQLEGDDVQGLDHVFDRAFEDPLEIPMPKPPKVDYKRLRNARYKGAV